MASYLVKRLLLGMLTLFVILLVSYVLLRLSPGDPTSSNLFAGEAANTYEQSSEKGVFTGNAAMREKLFLDKPILIGFAHWFANVLRHGDFGSSVVVDPGKPTVSIILERLPVTLKLNLCAIILTYLVAVFLGVQTAVRAGSVFDQTSTLILFFLYSLPVMWVGLLLQSMFCDGGLCPIFPLKGLLPPENPANSTWTQLLLTVKYYTLPVICLAYGGLASLSRYARNGMLEIIHSDYIRTARAKGLPENAVIWRHAFRNALITLISLFSGLLPALIAGSVLVEYIFNIPGMGTLSLVALSSRDYPLVMTLFAASGFLTLAGILLADLLYMAADPRISLADKKS